MTRRIVHLDLDAFFCAVEEKQNPSLRGKPFAVGGRPDQRGVVSSCSYAARQQGIRSAMPMSRAKRLCPSLTIISPRHNLYEEVSQRVMAVLHGITPHVEQVSIDEAFLDISDIPESSADFASALQRRIREELGLPCSMGVASNKLVAKIATDVGKKAKRSSEPPNAIIIVPAGDEAAFLAELPTDMLWGVGPKTAAKLAEIGIHTIGDIAAWPEQDLVQRFGVNGRDLARHARGIDESPIITEHEIKSISQEVTFARDVRDDHALQQTLRDLACQVGQRLRKNQLAGATVKIKIRWPDFTTLTRQITLSQPTDQDDEIAAAALAMLNKVRPPGKAVRLIGVGVSGLGPPMRQLPLWEDGTQKARRLQSTVDELKERYGKQIIRRGDQEK